jgi:hypothetical protein
MQAALSRKKSEHHSPGGFCAPHGSLIRDFDLIAEVRILWAAMPTIAIALKAEGYRANRPQHVWPTPKAFE